MVSFKVMTWNVENLFLPASEFGTDTSAQFAQKLDSLASVVLTLDPDVLALQEVGSPEAFWELANALEERYSHRRLSQAPDRRGIRVGFLSKLEIEDKEDIVDFPQAGLPSVPGIDSEGELTEVTRFSQGALRIRVSPVPNFSISLITAHLKSKLLTFPSAAGRSRFSTQG